MATASASTIGNAAPARAAGRATGPFACAGQSAVIVTMHGKEAAIAPALAPTGLVWLPAPAIDTDSFGTFARDIARAGSQHDALLAKARAGLAAAPAAAYAVASEGAFGPHPQLPFAAAGFELVVLIERAGGRFVIGRELTAETNFAGEAVSDMAAAEAFAARIGFPGHGLVAMASREGPVIAKGIASAGALAAACAPRFAAGAAVWLEADMRAHHNPTRMRAIGRAAADLARRLLARCPACGWPDWTPRLRQGRPCGWCEGPTLEPWREEWFCEACNHSDERRIDPARKADPANCAQCNP